MKFQHAAAPLLVLLITFSASLRLVSQGKQDDPNLFPPKIRMESRQGFQDQRDVVSHHHIAQNTYAKCISVQYNPEQERGAERAACILRYDTGEKYKLDFNEGMRFSKAGEIYLQCLGNKPIRCVVGFW